MKIIDTLLSWVGAKQGDAKHKQIIDTYNGYKPLPRGYKMSYTDAWCAATVSAAAISCGLTGIIPVECSCSEQIKAYQKMGRWMESDDYIPNVGDQVFYDWQDDGKGDNTGAPDHTGIVVSVSGNTFRVVEGNKGSSHICGYRDMEVNGKYIRGYGVPKYRIRATTAEKEQTASPLKVGEIVNFTGTKHYVSSGSANGKTCKPGKARVTALASAGKHPVHLVAVTGGGSNVYGWVDTAFIVRESVTLAAGARVKVNAGAKSYTGARLASFVYKNTYEVISISGDRVVIGVGRAITAAVNKKDLTVV